MKKEYIMGNGAIALGALAAGVNFVSGYPGTPSSEIVETIAKHPHDGVYIEWSVNEKAALEAAAAAATAVEARRLGKGVSDVTAEADVVGAPGAAFFADEIFVLMACSQEDSVVLVGTALRLLLLLFAWPSRLGLLRNENG